MCQVCAIKINVSSLCLSGLLVGSWPDGHLTNLDNDQYVSSPLNIED